MGVNPYFFLHIYSSWVEIRLPTENQPSSLPGSALKVCVVVGGGGWVGVESKFSVGFSLGQAEQNCNYNKSGDKI